MRKTIACILAAIQLLFPVGLIGFDLYTKSRIAACGEEYIIPLEYLYINTDTAGEYRFYMTVCVDNYQYGTPYYSIKTNEYGISTLFAEKKKPTDKPFIKSHDISFNDINFFPDIDEIRFAPELKNIIQSLPALDEQTYPNPCSTYKSENTESTFIINNVTYSIYAKLKVYKGHIIRLEDVLVDGKSTAEYIVPFDTEQIFP